MHKEGKGPIVDVVRDGHVERLDLLRAEDDVETSLLARGDHLAQRCAVEELGVLVHHDAHVDVLTKVVRDVKRLGRHTLNEDVFEVDLLWASNDFLQLFSCQVNLAVAKLVLGGWFRLKLFLDDTVVGLLLTGSHPVKVGGGWLVLTNGLLDVQGIDLLNEFKPRLGCWSIHA